MAARYLETYFTPDVLAAQQQYYGRARQIPPQRDRDPLTFDETEFISRRDSFYLATLTSSGWPYLQHRGGPRGFLKVVGTNMLAFADYNGNRQLLSTGNLSANDRVALFLMDYPSRERLKIVGHARVDDARARPDLVDQLVDAVDPRIVERVVSIDVISYDWNCSKYITPRYSAAEVDEIVQPLQAKIAELEEQLKGKS
jgi:uncharacterized protein